MNLILLVRQTKLLLISPQTRVERDLRDYLEEGEKMVEIGHVAKAVATFELPSRTRVFGLLDFPWTCVRAAELPPFKRSKIKGVMVNQLQQQFAEEMGNVNFDYYQLYRSDRKSTHCVIYSCHREISEELNAVLQEKNCHLASLHPFPHLVERRFAETLGTEEPLRYFHCSDSLITVFKYDNRFPVTWDFVLLGEEADFASVRERILSLRRLWETTEDDTATWTADPDNLPFVENVCREKPLPSDFRFSEDLSFEGLFGVIEKLRKNRQVVDLKRLRNAFFKNLHHARHYLASAVAVACLAFLVYVGMTLNEIYVNERNHETLRRQFASLTKEYLPGNAPSERALRDIRSEVEKLKSDWEKRKPFMKRSFEVSEFLLTLGRLKSMENSVVVNSVNYGDQRIVIKGETESEAKFRRVSSFLEMFFEGYQIKTTNRTVKDSFNFEIVLERAP